MLAMFKTFLCCTYSTSLFKSSVQRCIDKRSYTNEMVPGINCFQSKTSHNEVTSESDDQSREKRTISVKFSEN